MKDEIKISKSNHSIVIIKNEVTVKEQFGIDDEILDYITNLQEENKRLNNLVSRYDKELTHKEEQYNYLRKYNCLANMKQHPIERDLFCKIFYKIYEDYYDYLFDTKTENFKLWHDNDNETFYILHLASGTLITWYKHLGRCLECNKELSIDEYQFLANELKEDLENIRKAWCK